MKREIKFRGKRKDNGEWVYGDLCDYFRGSGKCIMPDSYFASRDFGEEDEKGNPVIEDDMAIGGFISVEPETVGQYTGLKDSKGVEIYEGDIFDKGIVVFSNGCFNGCYTCGTTSKKGWDYSDEWEDGLAEYARKNKVIGNIYQNPELINI